MQELDVLTQIYEGKLSAQDGYDTLYPLFDKKTLKRARFLKMKIKIKEEDESRAAKIFLTLLFILPVPLFLIRFGLRIAKKKGLSANMSKYGGSNDFTDAQLDQLIELTKYAKHTRITVESDDADVIIKLY